MVSQPVADRTRMSVQEYFELERSSPDRRYEYIDGEVYLMAGGTFNHSTVSINYDGISETGRGGAFPEHTRI
jgi:Uma2 family endonuclease